MRRLPQMVANQRIKLDHLVTHNLCSTYALDDVLDAHELFGAQSDGVAKVALKP